MGNKVKDREIEKNRTYFIFNDIINIKIFDSNNINIDKRSFIYYIGYATMKDSKYVKVYGVNPLYLIFNKVNGYFKEINGNKYLTLVSTNETKEKRKKYEELWSKIRDLIWMKNNIMIQKDDYVTKLQCVQNHYVLGSTK